MDRLPDTTGMRNEFIVPRSHRNSYDHAVRAAGGRFVEAGVADRIVGGGRARHRGVGTGGARSAERTAGFFYVARPDSRPALAGRRCHRPPQPPAAAGRCGRRTAAGRQFTAVSSRKAPTSWYSAAARPSAARWRRAFSADGGSLIASALLQQLDLDFEFDSWQPPASLIDKRALKCVPRNGIGRACKVGKEQIVGLLLALEAFASTPDAAREERFLSIAQSLLETLRTLVPASRRGSFPTARNRGVPRVEISVPATLAAQELADRLRGRHPTGARRCKPRAGRGAAVDPDLPVDA